MREIKFRAIVIDDDGKERLEYNVWPTGPSPGMRHLRGLVDNGGFWMDCIRFEQFTGLKDTKGKEIYEGDIVRLIDANRIYTCEVVDYGFSLVHADPKMNKMVWGGIHRINELGWECEVVGNIYENHELLK